ncbi:type II toxin-antitoxin system VapC family toxin [Pseudomarimonas arenosa]|uniref:Type II toxin-antitoxin system VapC family toxin n=1 Tax=Pseudomarimonas arenosa TaxID=2774145 RepID=A0AAW3ZJI9_9GAMM|nr:type II toxin-antitoxin system VapC family toxin [Pseudomarimonas arenosa]MBD8525384.1 type II toxin-antitoxin system VapC family toxin [Pseudomarimonas arenosa]
MRLLLDTHVALWAIADSKRLSKAARSMMTEADEVYVSAASVWEVAIKRTLGKIDLDAQTFASAVRDSGFMSLAISDKHAAGVQALPLHHADPFDRLLAAQAIAEPLRLLTADPQLEPYSELVVRV